VFLGVQMMRTQLLSDLERDLEALDDQISYCRRKGLTELLDVYLELAEDYKKRLEELLKSDGGDK
jgi:hypothetical protein